MGSMQIPLTLKRWRRVEYDRLVELGAFQGEPVELIAGQLIVAEPQGSSHASVINKVDYALRTALPPGWIVRVQSPISLDADSEPEPDLAVVPGRPGDYHGSHPARAVLVVEVAESSLDFDRSSKATLYARSAIPDYWIVNLVDEVLEVYRDPGPDPTTAPGWRYRSAARLGRGDSVTLVSLSGMRLSVSDLLP